jgi:hypothetical protein
MEKKRNRRKEKTGGRRIGRGDNVGPPLPVRSGRTIAR